ncbi:MAG: PEP-CTERM sorting domain-containing protein [Gammaproteobacteria bacterium]|nr:PEP-CTERM sorting domain-containing protein [Gammaproteobacteria bacterium]MBU1601245.1 PEP-CTERM sorting domain-containing protein [Gammaproteobacteria bacterium]MBU2433826.1 PEP-CTERM sorting domain-containing protein [Gammaproteobacteria bacterium]MBU2450656.1 PEP-CTERM sorting domain-containing protein [Gammaproteobacteria bacterium]
MNKKTCPASLLLATALSLASAAHAGPVHLTSLGNAYEQNFDTLANTAGSTTNASLPTGWAISEAGGGARDNDQYAVDTGGSNTGDIYSYGTIGATERALGSLRSGTLIPLFGVEFFNQTATTITALDIAFTGEQWRLGKADRSDRLIFQYSTDAVSLTEGNYVDFTALDFTTPDTSAVGAHDGNSAANRTALKSTISGLEIAANTGFWLRWADFDASGADDGLAIDDFSLSARRAIPEPGSLALASLALVGLLSTRRRNRR